MAHGACGHLRPSRAARSPLFSVRHASIGVRVQPSCARRAYFSIRARARCVHPPVLGRAAKRSCSTWAAAVRRLRRPGVPARADRYSSGVIRGRSSCSLTSMNTASTPWFAGAPPSASWCGSDRGDRCGRRARHRRFRPPACRIDGSPKKSRKRLTSASMPRADAGRTPPALRGSRSPSTASRSASRSCGSTAVPAGNGRARSAGQGRCWPGGRRCRHNPRDHASSCTLSLNRLTRSPSRPWRSVRRAGHFSEHR